jgi:hypothetical protein
MIGKRLDELRQRDDRRLIVAAMELMEERVAIRTGVEEAGERELLADRRLLLRRDDDLASSTPCRRTLASRRAIELERRRDSDARELERVAANAGVLQVDGPSTPAMAYCQSSSAIAQRARRERGSRSFSTRYAIASAAAAM